MNSDVQIPELPPFLDQSGLRQPETGIDNPSPENSAQSKIDSCDPSSTACAYRGNGYVARLPKSVRDQINNWMLDGVSYPDIIARLGEQGKHLKPDHLYQWKKRGHKDWLLHQDWLAERRARQESAADLVQDCDATQVNQSALQLTTKSKYRLGFDVAASGQGNLAVIYIDEANGDELSLRALFTCRTEDWHFLTSVLFYFLRMLKAVKAAGDETGLGKQICWQAASQFGGLFSKVNFSSKKHDLGFALMNQLSTAQKRFPRGQQDIAADYFALRKEYSGTRWVFSEGRNTLNPVSHCDIAWAGALASHAHTASKSSIGCAVLMEDGSVLHSDRIPVGNHRSPEERLLWSDDPRIWKPLRW